VNQVCVSRRRDVIVCPLNDQDRRAVALDRVED
jgi:hypothetical protein